MFAPAIKRPWNYTRTSPVKQPQTQCGNFYVAKADAVYRWPLNEILAQNVGEYEKLGEQPDVGKSQNQSREWSICLGITLPIANTCGPKYTSTVSSRTLSRNCTIMGTIEVSPESKRSVSILQRNSLERNSP